MDSFKDNTRQMIDIAIRDNASFLISKDIKELDKDVYKRIRAEKVVQKIFYNKVLNEIQLLISEFDKEKIKLVFVKGVFLALDLYDDISERSSKDIDISIDKNEYHRAHSLLRKIGYSCVDFSDEEIEADKHLEYLSEQHICYEKMNGNIKIYLELHGNILNAGEAFDFSTQEFLDNSVRCSVGGLTPYILKPEYNLIYLILHFFKHIPLSYTHYSVMGMKPEINLGALTDIVLLIEKYKNQIDWNFFLNLCKRMRIVRYIYVSIKLANDIYVDPFLEELLKQLQKEIIHTYMNEIAYERCGWGKFIWMLDKTLDVLEENNLSIILKGTFLDYIDMIDIAEKYSHHKVKVSDQYEFQQEFKVDLNIECGISRSFLKVTVNKEGINVSYEIKNKKIVGYTGEKKAYHCDGVDILVVTSKKIMHKLFILGNEQNGYYLAESSQDDFFETVNRVSNNKYEEKISVMEDSCFMNMRISWDEMGIDPLKDKVVPFNVAGLMTSPKTMENTGNYQLFDNKNDLFDFRYIPVLHFE